MYGMISFLPQMWSPPVMTWTPALNSSSASEGSRPLPPARFSPLAMTQSTSSLRQYSPMRLMMIDRPGLPTTSPIARILTFMKDLFHHRDHRAITPKGVAPIPAPGGQGGDHRNASL